MIETLLNYGEEAKTSRLSMALFYKDTPGKMDEFNALVAEDGEASMGLKVRYTFTKENNTVDMMGPIHSDTFFQDRLILNGVNLRLRLNRAKNSFCLVSAAVGADFKVVITEAILCLRKVKVASSIILGHAAALKQTPAKYPIHRVDCKVLSIPRGYRAFSPDNLFLGHIPKRLVLALADTEAFNGTYTSNLFHLKHHNLSQIGVYVDGDQIPRNPYFSNLTRLVIRNSLLYMKAFFQALEGFHRIQATKSIAAITVLVTQLSVLTCPQTTARVIILSS